MPRGSSRGKPRQLPLQPLAGFANELLKWRTYGCVMISPEIVSIHIFNWLKGKSTGHHRFSKKNTWVVPVFFPLNQSIDVYTFVTFEVDFAWLTTQHDWTTMKQCSLAVHTLMVVGLFSWRWYITHHHPTCCLPCVSHVFGFPEMGGTPKSARTGGARGVIIRMA